MKTKRRRKGKEKQMKRGMCFPSGPSGAAFHQRDPEGDPRHVLTSLMQHVMRSPWATLPNRIFFWGGGVHLATAAEIRVRFSILEKN